MTDEIHPTAAEIAESIDRLARTTDGANLYVFLQRSLMYVPTTTKSGALRLLHGERMFASRLIGLMAKGIHESGGRTSSTGGSGSSEQPLVVPSASPRTGGSSTARRAARDSRIADIDIGGAPAGSPEQT